MFSPEGSSNYQEVKLYNHAEDYTLYDSCYYQLKVRDNGNALQFRPMSKVDAMIYAEEHADKNGRQAKMWNNMD